MEQLQETKRLENPEQPSPPSNDGTNKEEEKKESQADILIRLASVAEFFRNDVDEAYAAIVIADHQEVHKVQSKKFKLWLTKLFFEETGKAPSAEAMNQALGVLEMMALYRGGQNKLHLRTAEKDGIFYYDLADDHWGAVQVSSGKVEIIRKPPIVFYRNRNMKAQVTPDFDGRLNLLLSHVRIQDKLDRLLYLIYIVTCLIPNIAHPVLVISGEKGAAKSTTIRLTRSIVDPVARDLLSMPTSIQDLALVLANNYMPAFDNLDYLSPEKSDLLCTASTGGGFSKRTLYTDDDETILSFKRCVTMNGINIVATRPDLLDRSIIIELQRIKEKERKEESTLWADFERDKPLILGGALRLLAKAMSIYPDITLSELYRMADFTRWGYAIAEAAGVGGKNFLEAYKTNMERSNMEAIEAHPVAAAVIALLDNRHLWSGPIAELLETLELVAIREKINTRVKNWPKAAHVLSMRLKEVKSNLEKKGIRFDIRNQGYAKVVTFEKGDVQSSENETQDDSPDAEME